MSTKILIIRFSSIGDIVLTTPVIRCLKEQLHGETELHFLTKKQFAPVLKAHPYLEKIHVINRHVSEVMEDLKGEQFDYVVDLHKNIRSSLVKGKLKALSFSFNKLNLEKWLMVNFKINRLPEIHIADRYLQTVSAFGIKNDGEGLDYYIPEKDELELDFLPENHQKGYIAFAIGAKHATKKMPLEKVINICRKINFPIVLLGDETDRSGGEHIANAVGNQVVNTCGLFNINQSASLIRQAQKVISHDSGLMHIAAAFKKTIISVWGNTLPEFGMYPYLPQSSEKALLVQVKGLSCRPCSKLGYEKCPKKHFKCMNLIQEDEIVKAVNG